MKALYGFVPSSAGELALSEGQVRIHFVTLWVWHHDVTLRVWHHDVTLWVWQHDVTLGVAPLCNTVGVASLCNTVGVAPLCNTVGVAPLCNTVGVAHSILLCLYTDDEYLLTLHCFEVTILVWKIENF